MADENINRSNEYNQGYDAGRKSQSIHGSGGGYDAGRQRDEYSGGFDAGRLERYRGEVNLSTQVALLQQTIGNYQKDLSEVYENIKEIRGEIKNINDMANKYRGGLLVVLALGGIIGTLVTLSDKIIHWFH